MPADRIDPAVFQVAFAVAAAISVVGILFVPWYLARLPSDFFVRPGPVPPAWAERHPALYGVWHVARNLVGLLLVIAGMAMLVLPGQGLLTLVVGFTLLQFPGKRRLELWMVRRRAIRRSLDWIRARAGSAPLVVERPRFRGPDRSS